jgi:hypothetical protein
MYPYQEGRGGVSDVEILTHSYLPGFAEPHPYLLAVSHGASRA